jgi:hypothetical protein
MIADTGEINTPAVLCKVTFKKNGVPVKSFNVKPDKGDFETLSFS